METIGYVCIAFPMLLVLHSFKEQGFHILVPH
jgi:hypothetical protein